MQISDVPIIGSYIKRTIENVEKFGLQEATKREIERSGSKLKIYGLDKNLINILKEKPVVVSVNHQDEIELLALSASLPERKDLFFIGTALLLKQAPILKRYLIPVYIRHHSKEIRHTKFRSLSGALLEKFYRYNLTPEEEHQKNVQSINEAAEKVKKGGLVVIVPNPHVKKWYSGIGWLLKNIGPMKDGFYIRVYVADTSNLDYLRLFPKIGRILPSIKVYFAKPQEISNFDSSNPKKLTTKLEREYNNWTKGISKYYHQLFE